MGLLLDNRWEVQVKSKPIGDGGFGEVFRGVDKSAETPQSTVAVKRVPLTNGLQQEAFEAEVNLMKTCSDHESIATLHAGLKDKKREEAWIVMEMADGGELFDRLIDSGSLSERAAWPYIHALVQAIVHCHSKGVAHRDIKLENVMLLAEDPLAIRLIDFGLAVQLRMSGGQPDPTDKRTDAAGTQAYRAPEMIGGEYDPLKVDMWALGIVLFSLCAGFFPLREATSEDWRFKRLKQDQASGVGACDSIFKMYKRTCPFTPMLKDFLDGLLKVDPAARLSTKACKEHEWLQKEPAGAEPDDDEDRVIYRSIGSADDEYDKAPPPDGAPPIMRQKDAKWKSWVQGDASDAMVP